MYQIISKTIDLGDGRQIVLETGKLARQADGAVLLRMGNTMLLATVVAAKEPKEDVDFLPLQVEYKEKYAAGGRFPGGFLKRETKPSDYEILVSRLVDRALRPLFPQDFHAEIFVTVTLVSADKDIMPDALAGLAASAAIAISDLPFHGPVSEVRVGRVNGKMIINPTFSENSQSDMDIMVAATKENIMMVEGEMNEISEEELLEAIKFAHEAIKKQCEAVEELMKMAGKTEKMTYCHEVQDEQLRERIEKELYGKIYEVAKSRLPKKERTEAFQKIKEDFLASLPEEERETKKPLVDRYYHEVEKRAMRRMILDEGIRLDGRKTNEIRPISCEVDCLPSAHGSSLFTRGETQSLTTVTLGTKLDEKQIDEVLIQGSEKFVLHYNFPPFATGEAKPQRGLSRREIGHGNLALRALKRLVPAEPENPYAIRVVSDILESNGSSSMATVCAGTLALMDAGIQLKKHVSGIAMGLITENGTCADGRYAILSDILGDEDHLGDMDFKVAGTKDGITATQMDIKVEGLTYDIMARALQQAREGRLYILDKLVAAIPAPRPELKPHAPRIEQIFIPGDKIGAVIGPAGKVIQEIQKQTGATIVIEEVEDKGQVEVFADNKESIEKAIKWIKSIVQEAEVGAVYTAKVKSIMPYGAFCEFLPGKEGLLHVSEIQWEKTDKVEDVLKDGQEIEVKLLDIDKKTGKYRLSHKVLVPKPEGFIESEKPRPSTRSSSTKHSSSRRRDDDRRRH